jgi:hypothetical protein
LLTGRPPRSAARRDELLQIARKGELVPPRQHVPRLPGAVNELCLRCLAKEPADRFASAADLAHSIRRWQWRRRLFWPAVAAVLLALVPAILWLTSMLQPEPSSPSTPPEPIPHLSPAPTVLHIAEHPDNGRPLRQDFVFEVELIGSKADPKEKVFVLEEGKQVAFRLKTLRKCYVAIWYIGPKKIFKLFPNDYEEDHRLAAGKERLVPGDDAREDYAIEASPSPGPEYVHVIAATNPLRPIQAPSFRAGVYEVFALPDAREQCAAALRGLTLVERTDAVAEVILPIKVRPKNNP